MAMRNPVGRANYQPNSWGAGPRESPTAGFRPFPETVEGQKLRIRPESFADHYSQARQFYISQTANEQAHIAAALTFELAKVKTPIIRERMVSHLLNIDEGLAQNVANGLGLQRMPKPAEAAVATRTDLEPSSALSIAENGPRRFEGRKLGILMTDGADIALFNGLVEAVEGAGAVCEVIAPKVGGITASDGSLIEADEMIDGGPSVLYDAVAILSSREGIEMLAREPGARDFVADAFAHCKFIGYAESAIPLLRKAGVADMIDEGIIVLQGPEDAAGFVATLGQLRLWPREPNVRVQQMMAAQ